MSATPGACDGELLALKQELLRTQRMAALGELTGTTTHEFNNVLMTIINYAKLGARHKDEATRDKAFDRILAAATRAEKITSSILGMARNRSDEFTPTDLAALIEQSLVLLEREMQKYRVAVRGVQLAPVVPCFEFFNGCSLRCRKPLRLATLFRPAWATGSAMWRP